MTPFAPPAFSAETDTATAFAQVWQQLCADVRAALAAWLQDPGEDEALHDLRIALRQSRALLTLCPAKLPGRRRFARAFRHIAHATSPLRDLDVLLKRIADAPAAAYVSDMTSLEIALQARRSEARAGLHETLRTCGIEGVLADWEDWLEEFPQRPELRARWRIPAVVSIEVLVRDQSLELLRRGSRIDRDSPASALHKLRIRGKRLRYLLESFLPLFDQNHYRPLVQALTDLQDLLGKHQDAVALRRQLAEIETDLARTGLLTPESSALIDYCRKRAQKKRRKARKAFPAALQDFADACART